MIKHDIFTSSKEIPFLTTSFDLTYDGLITNEDGQEITLTDFNKSTGLEVFDIQTLQAIVFHSFNWPPVYWKKVKAKGTVEPPSPENTVLTLEEPVESLEFPGYYLIPYFSNYVISPVGKVVKKSTGTVMNSSRNPLGYYTYRLTDDSGKTSNVLRHRILCYAFKPYGPDVESRDVNHIDGIPGNDELGNLEWCSRSENMDHAYQMGLRDDNIEVEVRDVHTNHVYIFGSMSQAGRALGVTGTTISNRAKSNGYKVYNGYQVRLFKGKRPWPVVDSEGSFLAEFPDGQKKQCDGVEAARLAGVTRTSLLRMLREGRNTGKTDVKISRIQS